MNGLPPFWGGSWWRQAWKSTGAMRCPHPNPLPEGEGTRKSPTLKAARRKKSPALEGEKEKIPALKVAREEIPLPEGSEKTSPEGSKKRKIPPLGQR